MSHRAQWCSFFVAVAACAFVPSEAHAQTQVCSGLLPIAVVPPPGDTAFATGCGNQYTLTFGSGSGGTYGFLDLPACDSGVCAGMDPAAGATGQCLILNGFGCCIDVGNVLALDPNSPTGFVQALISRFDSDTDQREATCIAVYAGNSRRFLKVAITTPLGTGRTTASVLGFATAWLAYRPVAFNAPLRLEFLPAGTTAVPPSTWGRLRLRYR